MPNPSPTQEVETTHELKCWPPYFEDIRTGRKNFECRVADRFYAEGDTLRLREFDPEKGYTGRELTRRVTYVLHGGSGGQFGVGPGHCVIALTQPDLQAEVEKREEVEGERDDFEGKWINSDAFGGVAHSENEAMRKLLTTCPDCHGHGEGPEISEVSTVCKRCDGLGVIAEVEKEREAEANARVEEEEQVFALSKTVEKAEGRRRAAESKLSSAVEALEGQAAAAGQIEDSAETDHTRMFWAGIRLATETDLDLLRDKGTGARDVDQVDDAVHKVGEKLTGVAIEGDPGPEHEPWTGQANIAWCPKHGLHGARDTCFECGQPVEQIPMVRLRDLESVRGTLESLAGGPKAAPASQDRAEALLAQVEGMAQEALDALNAASSTQQSTTGKKDCER